MKVTESIYSGRRVSVITQRPFDEVVAAIGSLIAHPDREKLLSSLRTAESAEALEQMVEQATAPIGLMEFLRFNLGEVIQKRFDPQAGRSVRILVGNPVTMSSMATHVPDAGSYAPVTVLIDERADGVHLTYDTMESYLSGYRNEAALQVARDLDDKVLTILKKAAE